MAPGDRLAAGPADTDGRQPSGGTRDNGPRAGQRDNGFRRDGHGAGARENARTVLEICCRARAGESVLLLADDELLPWAAALSAAAVDLGLVPVTLDIRAYLASPAYGRGLVLDAARRAIESADIVLQNLADTWVPNRPDYGRLCGDPDLQDQALTGERRWMILQCRGLDQWEVAAARIAAIRERTQRLMARLEAAREGRITSAAGTDLAFGLGQGAGRIPVLGIVPLYGEVAVTPILEGTSGTLVVDGPSQRGIRPAGELDREPLRLRLARGRLVDACGDTEQLARLRAFVAGGSPPADAVDEVGIPTTDLAENDRYYWTDGTHHHDRLHVALGNSARRAGVVHGAAHADLEVDRPTLTIDGETVVERGEWVA